MSFHTHNPLSGADPELQAMAHYYLGPDFVPVMAESQLSSAPNTSTSTSKGASSAVKALKKLKRNERDRQRRFDKRASMQQMRQEVKDLEGYKQRLVESTGAVVSPSFVPLLSPTVTSVYLTPIQRANFVHLANEIEDFRHQNAEMSQQLRKRDVTMGYMQNLLLEFSPDETDSDSSTNSGSDTGTKSKTMHSLGSSSRPGHHSVRFTPLTHKESHLVVHETLQHIRLARLLYASDANYRNRSTFLGWEQYTQRVGSTITFSVKKSLFHVTPAQLIATTWNVMTDEQSTQKLIPSTVNTHIRPLQKLSDDFFVIDRRTEDTARSGVLGTKFALRTVYILFRTADADGSQTLAMKTINLPLVKKLLRHDEQWCEIFYWMHFMPDGRVQSSSGHNDVAAIAEFGGSNTTRVTQSPKHGSENLCFLLSDGKFWLQHLHCSNSSNIGRSEVGIAKRQARLLK